MAKTPSLNVSTRDLFTNAMLWQQGESVTPW